jgi:hypothetical protein
MQLETAELKKGLDDIKHKLKEAGDATEGLLNFEVFKEIGHLAFEAAEKLGEFVLQGAEAADKMGKLAQQTGLPVEEFSRLAYAAKISKLSTEEFAQSLGKLDQKLAAAAAGGKEQVNLFHALGVSVKDATGATRSGGDVLGDLAEKFSKMSDGASKTTLAVDLFGKAGKQMIPFLNEGRDGIRALGEEADRLGVTMDTKTVRAATEFNENVDRIKAAVEGVATRVAGQLAPAMADLAEKFLHSKAGAEALNDAVTVLTAVMKGLVTAGLIIGATFEFVGTLLAGVASAVVSAATGDFSAAGKALESMQEELTTVVANAGERIQTVWSNNSKSFEEAGKAHNKMADKVVADIERMKGAAQKMEEEFRAAKALAEKLTQEHFAETDTAHKIAGVTNQGVEAQNSFANIGAAPKDIWAQATKGFKDYYDAQEQYTQAQLGIINEQAAAADAKKNLDVEGYDFAMQALAAQEEMAKQAEKAVEGFKNIRTDEATKAAQLLQNSISEIGSLVGSFVSKLGEFGQVVQAGIQGFQQGGWWGAIAAVLIEILGHFKRFAEITDISNKVLVDLIDALKPGLNALVSGLDSFMQGIDGLVKVIGAVLNGPLREVGRMLSHIGDFLTKLFDGIGPAIESLGEILGAFQSLISVLDPMRFVLKLLGALFTIVGIALLEVSNGIQTFLAWVFEAIRNLLAQVGLNDAALAISKIENSFQRGAQQAQDKVKAMWAGLGDTFTHFFDDDPSKKDTEIKTDVAEQATANVKDLGEATAKTATSMSKLNAQLTNVPSGFRIDQARFNATQTVPGGGGGNVSVTVQGSLLTEAKLHELIENLRKRERFQKHGTPTP